MTVHDILYIYLHLTNGLFDIAYIKQKPIEISLINEEMQKCSPVSMLIPGMRSGLIKYMFNKTYDNIVEYIGTCSTEIVVVKKNKK